ncbi:ribonuclease-III-like-domain-containing protein [Multifurca ochricompacta]|uniref:Ribonuclease-III-like-domain-containing protein n=1 Tax=Multifurca ochricompacta TaxID=376703 RepID=A0AAD4M597_9AGAM|nr:ribonuclease-III-like-domain-containing protein [Multifurca ochricompacta]
MSRTFRSISAKNALNTYFSRSLISTAYSISTRRRLHVHAEAARPTDSEQRIATPNLPNFSDSLSQHLNQTFKPLKFPPALAQRILTHLSHRDSVIGHNSRFAFLGRRTLEAYLLLFLQGLPAAADHDHSRIVARVLNTHTLGEHVTPHWKLQDVMRWTPPRAADLGFDGRTAGLHKVAGTMVEAVVGGVLHQFGGSVAHRLFHTRMLPHLLLPGSPLGLPDVLHPDALKAAERYGGTEGPLTRSP